MTELARLQLAPHELMRVAAIMAVGLVVVLSEAAFSGSMAFFLIVLALWLAIRVYQNPEEAIQAGILFMIACNVLLPASNRFDWTFPASELYYWATGILIITIAAVARIGIRSLLRIPASVKVFVLVAAVAAFVGFAKGNAPSYVIRQFYGSLLLVLYFAIASRVGDERLFLHRLRTYGLLCAAGFFVYYAAVFGEYGFHKEVTSLGMQVGTVAVLCLLTGISENCASWIASGFVLLGVPLLLFSRHLVLTFVFAAALVLGVKASTKKSKLLFYAAAALVWMPSVFPEGAEIILDKAMDSPAIEKMLPPGARDVTSLVDRNLELMAG